MMPASSRPLARAIASIASVLVMIGTVAGPAEAKSDLTVSAIPVTVNGTRLIDVTAWGADDAGGFQRLCVEQQIGTGSWQQLACSPVGYGLGGSVHARVSLSAPGSRHYRARLYRVRSATGDQPTVDRTSPTITANSGKSLSNLASLPESGSMLWRLPCRAQ
jgi:hypothetical protein